MRLLPRSVVLAAALTATAFIAACGDSDSTARPTAPPPAELQDVVDAGAPAALALVNDGHTIKLHAAGAAKPTDRFRAGSITKSFVATVALQLVGERKLALSDTVERWLPGILPYGDRVTVREVAQPVPGTTEARQNFSACVIEDVHLLVAAVHHVQVLLLRIARERDSPDSPPRIGHGGRACLHPDVSLEVAHLVEHLDPIALPVADVQQSRVAHGDAMHDLCERAANAVYGFFVGRLLAELSQEVSFTIEHRDTAVAVTVGDVHIPVAGIDDDGGGVEEL